MVTPQFKEDLWTELNLLVMWPLRMRKDEAVASKCLSQNMEIPQSNSDLTIELTLFVEYSPEEMYTQLRSIKALVYETNW